MSVSHVVIDTKNFGLYSGGISAFARPLIKAWLSHRPDLHFSFVGPKFDAAPFAEHTNWSHHLIQWPDWLPAKLRHPFYDNVQFPRAVAKLKPAFIFSPYHDVLIPTKTPSAITIHDTCIHDGALQYPALFRSYYLMMLKRNLKRAAHILTVSQASRDRVMTLYGIHPHRITVIYNTIEEEFAAAAITTENVNRIKNDFGGSKLLFYPGGSEFRKNISRLVRTFATLADSDDIQLLVTGAKDARWSLALSDVHPEVATRIHFLGRMKISQMKIFYAAADAVFYPSLCEGFGRVCIEAMSLGTPMACSDLKVFREVAVDYPTYFDPTNVPAMVSACRAAIASKRMPPRQDVRFSSESNLTQFTALMDELLSR